MNIKKYITKCNVVGFCLKNFLLFNLSIKTCLWIMDSLFLFKLYFYAVPLKNESIPYYGFHSMNTNMQSKWEQNKHLKEQQIKAVYVSSILLLTENFNSVFVTNSRKSVHCQIKWSTVLLSNTLCKCIRASSVSFSKELCTEHETVESTSINWIIQFSILIDTVQITCSLRGISSEITPAHQSEI